MNKVIRLFVSMLCLLAVTGCAETNWKGALTQEDSTRDNGLVTQENVDENRVYTQAFGSLILPNGWEEITLEEDEQLADLQIEIKEFSKEGEGRLRLTAMSMSDDDLKTLSDELKENWSMFFEIPKDAIYQEETRVSEYDAIHTVVVLPQITVRLWQFLPEEGKEISIMIETDNALSNEAVASILSTVMESYVFD